MELVQKGLTLARTPPTKAFAWFLLADLYNRQGDSARLQEALAKANHFKSLSKGATSGGQE